MTEEQEAKLRTEEYNSRTELFMKALDVDEVIAQLLAADGFSTVEELSFSPINEFLGIEGFDETIAQEIQSRALVFIEQRAKDSLEKARTLGVSEEILEIDGMTAEMLLKLAEHKIKSLDDFADLAGDEFLEIIKDEQVTLDQANAMIMAARAHWFKDEPKA
jgi:N utilization substance protein A